MYKHRAQLWSVLFRCIQYHLILQAKNVHRHSSRILFMTEDPVDEIQLGIFEEVVND